MQELERLTIQQIQDLLERVYTKGSTTKNLEAIDIVDEMKQVILTYYAPDKDR